MALPTSLVVEVEFTAGVWTDVSTYLDGNAGGSIQFGRSSRYGATQPGTLTLTLDNTDGRFTPGRQLLADGAAHPYYPNVIPRKRIRVGYVVSGITYYRFTGYIKAWPPGMVDASKPRVTITASTVEDRLSRVKLPSGVKTEIHRAAPTYWWPLTDRVKSRHAYAATGNVGRMVVSNAGAAAITFGADGISSSDGTAVEFAGGEMLRTPTMTRIATIWFAFNCGDTPAQMDMVGSEWPGTPGGFFVVRPVTGVMDCKLSGGTITSSQSVFDGLWHSAALTISGTTGTFYLDGVSVGTASTTGLFSGYRLTLGGVIGGATQYSGRISHLFMSQSVVGATSQAALGLAATSFAGETVDARLKRFLGYAGLTSSDWNVDASTVTLNSYDHSGKDLISASQDAIESEGGGSVFYAYTDGKVQFRNRAFRNPTAPVVTVDAEADLDGSTFQPAYDDTQVINEVQGDQADAQGVVTTQFVADSASKTTFGLLSKQLTSWADTDEDVLANAQDQLTPNPAFQIPQVAVDLVTATTAGLYAAVAGAEIGDRLRITNLPPRAAPTSTQFDGLIEGWTDTFNSTAYTVTFDLSPADAPARMVWDDATYGRWGCDGQTLNANITNSATTLAIATTAGKPTMTTSAGDYPLTIVIGTEHIRLNSAPGGSTSPQTFTGVTRAVDGTTAAAQTAGSAVDLAPAPTWTI